MIESRSLHYRSSHARRQRKDPVASRMLGLSVVRGYHTLAGRVSAPSLPHAERRTNLSGRIIKSAFMTGRRSRGPSDCHVARWLKQRDPKGRDIQQTVEIIATRSRAVRRHYALRPHQADYQPIREMTLAVEFPAGAASKKGSAELVPFESGRHCEEVPHRDPILLRCPQVCILWKNDMTGWSILLIRPRSIAMPTSSATMLLDTERSSCNVSGPNATLPAERPRISSLPGKYCSKTRAHAVPPAPRAHCSAAILVAILPRSRETRCRGRRSLARSPATGRLPASRGRNQVARARFARRKRSRLKQRGFRRA
jgi:hypothetical protein